MVREQSKRFRDQDGVTTVIAVLVLLFLQALMLAYSATTHSPTDLEPPSLASGVSHWTLRRFEMYRVNPPLVRTVASIPAVLVGCKTDWSSFDLAPGARPEYSAGRLFIEANGEASLRLVKYARWACIPFSVSGAFCAYLWAKDLYGSFAGLTTLILYVFEPNLLAHGELITPDAACTSFGILAGYTFWKWLKQNSWPRALTAGVALGLAELSKLSWLMLFLLWPLLWLFWRWLARRHYLTRASTASTHTIAFDNSTKEMIGASPKVISTSVTGLTQLSGIILSGLYVLNLGYAFDGTFTPLKDFTFVSQTLSGNATSGEHGNRFRESTLGAIPIPFPAQYVLGLDAQRKDFEEFRPLSYLRGQWKDGGWWYFYLYGLLVKVPCGTLILFGIVALTRLFIKNPQCTIGDEVIVLVPAFLLIGLASSQTEINTHLRYVFPSLGLLTIYTGQCLFCVGSLAYVLNGAAQSLARQARDGYRRTRDSVRIDSPTFSTSAGSTQSVRGAKAIVFALVAYSVVSSLCIFPHHLAYFNDFVGGPLFGHRHLLGSSFDWGQDLVGVEPLTFEKRGELPQELVNNEWRFRTAFLRYGYRFTDRDDRLCIEVGSLMSEEKLADIPPGLLRTKYTLLTKFVSNTHSATTVSDFCTAKPLTNALVKTQLFECERKEVGQHVGK